MTQEWKSYIRRTCENYDDIIIMVESLLKEERNKVLSEVQSEVEKMEDTWIKIDKKTGEESYIGGSQCRSCSLYRDSIRPKDISTIIENLKVK